MVAFISLFMVVQSNFCNRDFVIDYKFSMGLRPGEFLGQSNNFCFLKIVFTFTDERHGARSYWNFSPSGNALLISRMTFLSITSMYLYKCVIPLLDISEPSFERVKLPENIF